MAGVAAAVGVFNTLRKSVDGAISRYDTLNAFPKVLSEIGFSTEQAENAMSELSDGIQGLPTTLDDVAGTAQRLAIMTGDLDNAVDTTLALNNAFIASGSNSADASRGLQQYTQMLSKGQVDLTSWRTLQETMGIALNDVANSFGYAGESAQNDLYDALQSGEVTFDQFNSRLIELSNATGGFAELALTASGGIRTAFSIMNTSVVRGVTEIIEAIDEFLATTEFQSIENIFKNIGDTAYNALSSIANNIGPIISRIQELYKFLSPIVAVLVSVYVGIMAFNATIAVINGVSKAIIGVKLALDLLKNNPVALVIGILAGLAVMFIYLWKTSETFREVVTNAFQSIQNVVAPIIEGIKDVVMEVWGNLVSWWQENNQSIIDTAMEIFKNVYDFISSIVGEVVSFVMQIWGQLTSFWQENGQMIQEAVQNVWSFISGIIVGTAKIIWSIIQVMGSVIMSVMNFVWPFVEMLIISTWNAIKGAIQGAITFITGIIQFFSALFTGNWSALWESVKMILSGAIQFIWNWIQISFVGRILKAGKTLATTFGNTLKSMWDNIRLIFMYAIDAVRKFVLNGFTKMRTTISTITGKISKGIDTAFNFIKQIITNILTGIRNFISNIWNRIFSVISSITSRIRNKISEIFNSLRSIVSGAFTKVTSAVRTGINNAYKAVTKKVKDFFNAGKNIVTSIANGIKNAVGKVTSAITNVVDTIRDYLPFSPAKKGPLKDIMNVRISESIAESINNGKNYAVRTMRSLSNALHHEMPNINISDQVNRINRLSNRQMQYDFQNEIMIQKQPAYINLHLGRKQFSSFVEDITEEQERSEYIRKTFR